MIKNKDFKKSKTRPLFLWTFILFIIIIVLLVFILPYIFTKTKWKEHFKNINKNNTEQLTANYIKSISDLQHQDV